MSAKRGEQEGFKEMEHFPVACYRFISRYKHYIRLFKWRELKKDMDTFCLCALLYVRRCSASFFKLLFSKKSSAFSLTCLFSNKQNVKLSKDLGRGLTYIFKNYKQAATCTMLEIQVFLEGCNMLPCV